MTAVLFTCAGQRVDIVSAFGRRRDDGRGRPRSTRPALYHADHKALVPRWTIPATCRARRPGSRARRAARRPAHRSRPGDRLRERDALEPALVLAPAAEVCRTMGDKYLAPPSSRSTGSTARARGFPPRSRTTCVPLLVKVREGFGSRHIYRPTTPVSSSSTCGRRRSSRWSRSGAWGEFSIDVFCDTEGRCLKRHPALDDPVEGR